MGVYSWAAEETQHDVCHISTSQNHFGFGSDVFPLPRQQNELRVVVTAAMNIAAYILNTIVPNFVWKVWSLFLLLQFR